MEPLTMSLGCEYDLSQYEPQWREERDGLRVEAYDIDGQLILDFDWEPGGTWDQLEESGVFEQFAKKMLEALCGEEMEVAMLEGNDALDAQQQTPATSGCSLAGVDGADRDPRNCGCPL